MKKAICSVYVILLLVLGASSFVERALGTGFAHEYIYGSRWFFALWATALAVGVCYFVRARVRRAELITLHGAFVLILAGAALSHLFSYSGDMTLHPGQPTNIIYSERGNCPVLRELPLTLTMKDFQVEHHFSSEDVSGYKTTVEIGGKTAVISLNHPLRTKGFRFCQKAYDPISGTSTLSVSHDPYGIALSYLGYALLFASLLWLLVRKRGTYGIRHEGRWYAILGLGYLFFVCLYVNMLTRKATGLMPVLLTNWLAVHVPFMMFAYTLFAICFLCSLAGLLLRMQEASLARFCRFLLYPALAALCIGIFTGAIWANVSWGHYWTWDPKEVWALITMLAYAVPLHGKSIGFMNNPRKFMLYCVLAFLSILMTYFGVNLLLGGLHSYA